MVMVLTKKNHKEQGFSLIEVLVAVVVFALGIGGFAVLQLTGLRYAHNANIRFQAALQVNDMADRMRANMPGVKAGNYVGNSGSEVDCTTQNCTPASMASYDIYQWSQQNAAVLPEGTGTITTGPDGTYVITMSWVQRTGVKGSSGMKEKSFAMNFKP